MLQSRVRCLPKKAPYTKTPSSHPSESQRGRGRPQGTPIAGGLASLTAARGAMARAGPSERRWVGSWGGGSPTQPNRPHTEVVSRGGHSCQQQTNRAL